MHSSEIVDLLDPPEDKFPSLWLNGWPEGSIITFVDDTRFPITNAFFMMHGSLYGVENG